ncbi:hypothetical protein [Silvibacterium sp.]|uniref:hypothetical protein n=1 Tax=Silvibacterium sp. TaxID=1964179 RepID=UPI0039E3DE69
MTEYYDTVAGTSPCPETGEGAPDFPPTSASRFLARQPILNTDRRLIGYELLFRAGCENYFTGSIENATSQMIDSCVMLGVDKLSQHTLAFINCTREALVDRQVTVLPPSISVLEVLEGGNWKPCIEAAAQYNLTETKISAIYLEALNWARKQVIQLAL